MPEITRREMMARAAGLMAAGVGLGSGARTVRPARRRGVRLRVLGTHVTLQEQIRLAAERDLGFEIEFTPGGSGAVLQRASTRPESFDVYEQWSNSINVLWRSGAIQPIDVGNIRSWDKVNSLSKIGSLTLSAPIGRGDAPHTLLYAQPDGALSSVVSPSVSFLPYVHNVDSFGYDTRAVAPGEAYTEESWGWLLDPRWRGRVALVNEPTIGIFDAALAAKANGLISFEDIGNMSIPEIDGLFEILLGLRRSGHFTGFWNSVPDSVRMMERGRCVIESMFSPGATTLRGRGVPVRYAAPKEGYRAWHGVMCLSSATEGDAKGAAYEYMNWWLSGRPGAIMARQGYYISVPDAARSYMQPHEWDYWYAGLPASRPIMGADRRVIAAPGQVRNGGSYTERFSNVAVWNTVMDNYEYTLLRWGELLSTEPSAHGAGAP